MFVRPFESSPSQIRVYEIIGSYISVRYTYVNICVNKYVCVCISRKR